MNPDNPPPGVYASIVREVTEKRCTENDCNNILCVMILVEITGGRYDGTQFLIGACHLTKRD